MDIRDNIVDIVKRTFIGPDPIEGYSQSNGEEIIRNINPRSKYSAGILHPLKQALGSIEKIDDDLLGADDFSIVSAEEAIAEEKDEERSVFKEIIYKKNETAEIEEEVVSLANENLQSSMGFSCVIDSEVSFINVSVRFGTYDIIKSISPATGKEETAYQRKGHIINKTITREMIPTRDNEIRYFDVYNDNDGRSLSFAITKRYSKTMNEGELFTFSLINITNHETAKGIMEFYQCELIIETDKSLVSLPENRKITSDDDFLSNALLYRDIKTYGIGHGCSVSWDSNQSEIRKIHTESIPTYDMKYIVPSKLDGLELSMKILMSGDSSKVVQILNKFCEQYSMWIDKLKENDILSHLEYKAVAEKHIDHCTSCLNRMRNGVRLLEVNEKVMKAFNMMNEAMFLQQLHYNLPLNKWTLVGNELIPEFSSPLPIIEDRETWYGDKSRYGQWRPFQLAFILINLEAMYDSNSEDREIIDLIWFPTGGGKTEAYLGLSAYTIFIRRLMDPDTNGTAVLMRYTLRLLTTQQYERASSLICACESLRKSNTHLLGEHPINIGLWVGESLSDNTTEKALSHLKELQNNKTSDNRFLLLKCPWCGSEMGKVESPNGKNIRVAGYVSLIGKNKFAYVCSNKKCDYSTHSNPLPLEIIDDQIYKNPPTLIIGTVDKFAVLPFKPEAKAIFGIIDNQQKRYPPELIIQDELHLISGPLGSMVGIYEFLIKELCGIKKNGKHVYPKIIASTATISNAKQQCKDLYGVDKDKVFQFPPQGITYKDSFFAIEEQDKDGRRYVGLNIPDSSSSVADTKLYSSLLYAGRAIRLISDDYADSYWTILAYFNSLRDLGQTKTWVNASISDSLTSLYVYRKDHVKEGFGKNRRYINHVEELTSRVQSGDIARILQSLSTSYNQNNTYEAVDMCLASNMISVGIDISRLALMTVSGQPKTTSEYIQATSRVGRGKFPGLVFTHYYHTRPRDKSHYEQFQSYHSKIYTYVEPTSVTPFSPQVRKRALHAILVAYYRILSKQDDPSIIPEKSFLETFYNLLKARIAIVDPNELNDTNDEMEKLLLDWEEIRPQIFSTYTNVAAIPLIYYNGLVPNELWGEKGWPTQSSMRSVDLTCKPKLVNSSAVESE